MRIVRLALAILAMLTRATGPSLGIIGPHRSRVLGHGARLLGVRGELRGHARADAALRPRPWEQWRAFDRRLLRLQ